jgi:hypothetical protein
MRRETGQTFDKYGCLARDFKSEPPCQVDKPRVDWETREFNQSRMREPGYGPADESGRESSS